jgi:hypothetical protein
MHAHSRHGAAAGLCGALMTVIFASPALAHGVIGDRFFPATLATDDPSVADELSLPTLDTFKTGDSPAVTQTDLSVDYSKRITPQIELGIGATWSDLHSAGGPHIDGFQNIESDVKYQFFNNIAHETILSVGVDAEWGDTGARRVGADAATTFTPTFFFGKGAGDLPESLAWARPFAVTGSVGYSVPTRAVNAQDVVYGFAFEYSLPYLNAHVHDYGLPNFVNHLTPLVEMSFDSPVVNGQGAPTTGTINPGVIWSGRRFQVGVEAMVPINRQSGGNIGALVQLHFYLDDIFPASIGKPIWGGQ